ncbi:PREDICTED: F-box/kelch-repeat protein At5g49000-like [Camelina sativa]|uniref:F-box/kelch-repeat protein At5g49000-like n=1 Tax=Camelina sativa TaxID=90675 RepID=A0ABM0YXH7_CAMSA|nr:PREDICTED: F-box/kelch-repeat protein At5g49000-like [Camelina sativa]
MAFLWDKYVPSSGEKEVWCAVIALERHSFEEMCGEVEWLDVVLTVPLSYEFVSALVATYKMWSKSKPLKFPLSPSFIGCSVLCREKKMMSTKKPSQNNPALSLLSLPDDLLLSCFARISRLYYPILSLVSKRFRSILSSPELYETLSFLGRTESVLYVCFQFNPGPNTRWFTLCRKPEQTLSKKKKKKKSSGYVLAALPTLNSPPAHSTTFVVVGGSRVQVCRWTNVLDDKIYVAGGSDDYDASNWMEVFDPKTQTWETKFNTLRERCGRHVWKSAVIDDEIYMYRNWGVAYKPKEDRWKALDMGVLKGGWVEDSYCVIDNILYCYHALSGMIWYDSKQRNWKPLRGLKVLSKCSGDAYLASHGGKMAVVWNNNMTFSYSEDKKIWCAVIAL